MTVLISAAFAFLDSFQLWPAAVVAAFVSPYHHMTACLYPNRPPIGDRVVSRQQ